jgi:hypothetical protein
MPAAVYRTLRSRRVGSKPDPMTFGRGFAYQSSEQFVDYLLCEACEDRIRRRGEDWVLANCLRPGGAFPILEILRAAHPTWQDEDIRTYSAARITEIDSDSLIYFATSVFWRAAAHTWRIRRRSVHIDLGPYEADFRAFLLGQVQFPQNAAIVVAVLERGGEFAVSPWSRNDQGYHDHNFTIPGLTFMLYLGGRVPQECLEMSLAPSPERHIFIYPRAENIHIAHLAGLYRRERRRQEVRSQIGSTPDVL